MSKLLHLKIRAYVFIFFTMVSSWCFSQNTENSERKLLYSKPPKAGIIEFSLPDEFLEDKEIVINLLDLRGVLEKSTTIQLTKETIIITWDTNKIGNRTPTGMYFLDIIGNNKKTRKKLIMDCGCRE